jgi:hypothetical protein
VGGEEVSTGRRRQNWETEDDARLWREEGKYGEKRGKKEEAHEKPDTLNQAELECPNPPRPHLDLPLLRCSSVDSEVRRVPPALALRLKA